MKARIQTDGLSPSGFKGFKEGFADSEPVRGRFSVGWRKGGAGVEGDEEGEDEGEDENGHIVVSVRSCS